MINTIIHDQYKILSLCTGYTLRKLFVHPRYLESSNQSIYSYIAICLRACRNIDIKAFTRYLMITEHRRNALGTRYVGYTSKFQDVYSQDGYIKGGILTTIDNNRI